MELLTVPSSVVPVDLFLSLFPGFVGSDVRTSAVKMASYPCLYSWGGPSTETIQKGDIDALCKEGGDCSGATLTMAVKAGIVSPEWATRYRGVSNMSANCDSVPIGSQKPGDFALYSGHVAMVLTEPQADLSQHSYVLSMSGGNSSVHGDNPLAKAKILRNDTYRTDFICYMRPKSA